MLAATVCLEDGANGPLILPQENKKPDYQSILLICARSPGSARKWEEQAENQRNTKTCLTRRVLHGRGKCSAGHCGIFRGGGVSDAEQ